MGSTDDPQRRLAEHNSTVGHCTFTHKHGPWVLVWTEAQQTRAAAMAREKKIKAMKSTDWIRRELLNR